MSDFKFRSTPYLTKDSRELAQQGKEKPALDPWVTQRIVFEILETHLLRNDPEDLGYGFTQKYNLDPTKSSIFIDISHNWKASEPQKRPAVFVYRGDADYSDSRILGQKGFVDVAESTEGYANKVRMTISVNCIAEGIGFAEEFANYIKYPFLYFSKNIKCEYGFTNFRLQNISAPEQFDVDAKDTFSIKLTILTEFYDKWAIQQEALKLKTVNTAVYTDLMEKPLEKQ